MSTFLGEIRRRKIFQVAAVYAVVAWLLVQIVTAVEGPLSLPYWFDTAVIVLLAVGFPVTMVMSWAFNLTTEGLVRDSHAAATARSSRRGIEYVLIALLAVALGWIGYRELGASNQVRAVLPNSVAVLPFENLATDEANAYFAVGIHDTILNELAKISDVNVIGRTSVLQYADGRTPPRQIAEELNVETVMEGTVQYADGQVRVTAQLIDPQTGSHLWSNNFDRPFADIFFIQSEIASQIAMGLEAELLPSERQSIDRIPTDSREAYALYLQALALAKSLGDAGLIQEYLDQALELDPDFALAYAWKAYSNAVLIFAGLPIDYVPLPRSTVLANADRALALDPELALAHAAKALIYQLDWQWLEAQEAFENALRLSPNDADVLDLYAQFKRALGELDESVALLERVVELNPAYPVARMQLAISHMFAQNHAEAIRIAEYTSRPDDHVFEFTMQVLTASVKNSQSDHEGAVAALQTAERFGAQSAQSPSRIARLIREYARAGRLAEAERLFRTLEAMAAEESVGAATWAMAQLAMGDPDSAYQAFQQAIDEKTIEDLLLLIELKANFWIDPILETPRFRDLRRQIGSPD